MRHRLASIFWLFVCGLLTWTFITHGNQIGGVGFLVHTGQGGAATAEVVLIIGPLAMAVCWFFGIYTSLKPISMYIACTGFAFAASFFLPIRPLRILSPYIFPFAYLRAALPFSIAVVAAFTYLSDIRPNAS